MRELLDAYMRYEPQHLTACVGYNIDYANGDIQRFSDCVRHEKEEPGCLPTLSSLRTLEQVESMKEGEFFDDEYSGGLFRYVKISAQTAYRAGHEPGPCQENDLILCINGSFNEYIAHNASSRYLPKGLKQVLEKHGFYDPSIEAVAEAAANAARPLLA